MDRKFYNDRGVIARWREFLPVTAATPVVSLNEGSTPLIHSPASARWWAAAAACSSSTRG